MGPIALPPTGTLAKAWNLIAQNYSRLLCYNLLCCGDVLFHGGHVPIVPRSDNVLNDGFKCGLSVHTGNPYATKPATSQ